MEKKKVLPWRPPQTKAWPDTNFLLSVIQDIPNGLEWALNSHIQMRTAVYVNYQWDIQDMRISFYPYAMHDLTPNIFDQCPFIDKYAIPRSFVSDYFKRFSSFVEYAIWQECYISLYVDQFFRQDIGETGYRHPIYIYGYDASRGVIYALDNFEYGKFASKEITYDDMQKAYDLVDPEQWESSVFMYRVKKHSYEFVPGFASEQLKDYLNPRKGICYFDRMLCPEKIHDGKDYYNAVYFGMECYDLLKKYILLLLDAHSSQAVYDVRNFCMIIDHKELMVQRYGFMVQNGYVKEDMELSNVFKRQLDRSRIMLNMLLKYGVKQKEDILVQILRMLDDFIADEKISIRNFINLIDGQ